MTIHVERGPRNIVVTQGNNALEARRQALVAGAHELRTRTLADQASTAAVAALAAANYFDTLERALASTPEGASFTTTDPAVALNEGEANTSETLRSCIRTNEAPYYRWLGPAADPASRADVERADAKAAFAVGKTSMTIRPDDLNLDFTLQDALDNADLVVLHDPQGSGFALDVGLQLPVSRPITLMSHPRGRASIRATAQMDALITQADTNLIIGTGLQGLHLDCNDFAAHGLVIQRGKAWIIDDIDVTGFLDTGMILGKDGASGAYCYEHQISRLTIDGGIAKAQAGTHPKRGIGFLDGATDNKLWAPVVSYVSDYGIDNSSGGNNCIASAHVYGPCDYSFVAGGECEFIGCFADTPRIAGYLITGERTQIIGGKVFANIGALGYTPEAEAFRFDMPHQITIIGVRLRNLGYDFNAIAPSDTSTVFGLAYSAVTTVSSRRNWAGQSIRTSGAYGAEFRAGSPAGQRASMILHDENDKSLWRLGKDNSSVSGNNSGADFDFDSYDDTGAFLATPLSMTRTGTVQVMGTYSAPFRLGALRMWNNSGVIYVKQGSNPTSAVDGTALGPTT
ncbi:hypothetical protein [Novosphingobium profundi]|uniref:hypothetical protein n=1 Tax=Novosphingobium profundi TaxID=1774954 RepID=UPI001CFDDDEA|nr:hypothetical protein [Novosphingobium profundi]